MQNIPKYLEIYRTIKLNVYNIYNRLEIWVTVTICKHAFITTEVGDHLPISWATIPLNQHPGARVICCCLPVLPTCEEHLDIWMCRYSVNRQKITRACFAAGRVGGPHEELFGISMDTCLHWHKEWRRRLPDMGRFTFRIEVTQLLSLTGTAG